MMHGTMNIKIITVLFTAGTPVQDRVVDSEDTYNVSAPSATLFNSTCACSRRVTSDPLMTVVILKVIRSYCVFISIFAS